MAGPVARVFTSIDWSSGRSHRPSAEGHGCTFCTKSATARLVCYLVCQFNQAPKTPDGSLSLNITVPRGKLASRLGVSDSIFSRAFRELEEKGLVVKQRNGIFIPDVRRYRSTYALQAVTGSRFAVSPVRAFRLLASFPVTRSPWPRCAREIPWRVPCA